MPHLFARDISRQDEMANATNNPIFEEDTAVEDEYNEIGEIQAADEAKVNAIDREPDARAAAQRAAPEPRALQPPPPPPRAQKQFMPRGYEAPVVAPRRGFGSPGFASKRPFISLAGSGSLERSYELEYKFPL